MSDAELTKTLRDFFEAYSNAFAAFDANRIADFYHDPTMTLRGDGSFHFLQGRAQIVGFFESVLENAYRPFQFSYGIIHAFESKPLGGRSVLATMEWDLLSFRRYRPYRPRTSGSVLAFDRHDRHTHHS